MSYSILANVGKSKRIEHFFVSYAVNGPTHPKTGTYDGMPINHPMPDSPLPIPSILNTQCLYSAPGFKPTCTYHDILNETENISDM